MGKAPPEHARDLGPARWLEVEVGQFGSGVRGLLPSRFESYARILHPAGRNAGGEAAAVSWAQIAAWARRQLHATAQFHAISVPAEGAPRRPPPFEWQPEEGNPPRALLAALADVLGRHTASSEKCWFCLWDGWGWVSGSVSYGVVRGSGEPPSAEPPPLFLPGGGEGPRVELPQRSYILLEGPLASVTEIGPRPPGGLKRDAINEGETVTELDAQAPSLFWPDDRSWCVASEIDLDSTYVGGSSELIEDLLQDERLEALPAQLDDRVDWRADAVNPAQDPSA